jgi:hypothetical protein
MSLSARVSMLLKECASRDTLLVYYLSHHEAGRSAQAAQGNSVALPAASDP